MKLKIALLSLFMLGAFCPLLPARTNAPVPAPPDTASTNVPPVQTPAAPAPDANSTNVVTTTTTTTATTNSVAAPDGAGSTNITATTATTTSSSTTTSTNAPGSTNQAAAAFDPNAVIPRITLDDVPLTVAINNLARLANLNYMLDPKINYGAPGPDGRPQVQPTVSLRWENLTADQALNALLNAYNFTIIDDPKTHVSRIAIKDPAAPDPLFTKIIQLKYAYATNLMQNAQAVLMDKRSKVLADARTSQLVVVATEKEMATIDELVARLDTQTKQVLIEARIVETSKNPTTSKGIDWTGTLGAQHFSFGNGNTTGTYTSAGSTTAGGTSAYNSGTGSLPVGTTTAPYVGANPVTLSTTYPNGTVISANGTGTTAGTTSSLGTGNILNSVVGNGGLSLNTARGLFPSTAFLNADGVSAVLSFLNSDLDATVLSTPRAVTLDNEEAILAVTTAQPIFETTAGTQGSPGGSQVIYTNLGTILHVTPRISANNTISLKVIPEVSDVAGTISKTVNGLVSQADVYDIRRIETRVLIPSGNTLVMGGLVGDNQNKTSIKVPVMGDIPFLGAAFRQESKSQNKKNLIIFITPTIVQNEDFQPTESSFLKTKVPDHHATEFGPWDSGQPQDWSKLIHAKKPKSTDQDNNGDIPTTD